MLTPAQQLRELRLTMQELSVTGRGVFRSCRATTGKTAGGQLLFAHSYEGYKFPEEKQAVLDLIDDGLNAGNGQAPLMSL